jgi:hypothetical protein
MSTKPIWQQIEEMSPRKRSNNVLTHQENLNRFIISTKSSIDKLSILRKAIEKSEKKIIKALESEKQAEAISEILRLRILRIEEMVELSALSLTRANRFYNQLVLDVTRGVEANVKYDSESIKGMVPDDLKTIMSESIEASDFYDILSNYKDKLKEFVQPEEGSE